MTADAYLVILCDHPGCPEPEGHYPVRFTHPKVDPATA